MSEMLKTHKPLALVSLANRVEIIALLRQMMVQQLEQLENEYPQFFPETIREEIDETISILEQYLGLYCW